MEIIGTVHSPYKEKFAIPRQPGLVGEARGRIELLPPFHHSDAVRGLDQFSHIWVLFLFHKTQDQRWKPLVRPPRLGGNNKVGVFASRSTFRPNSIGLSVVKLEGVTQVANKAYLEISALDMLDQTPVVDIKPYIPYADSLPEASAGFADHSPPGTMTVAFSDTACRRLQQLAGEYPQLKGFIRNVLAQDPRPAYKNRNSERQLYGMRLYDFNITWAVERDLCQVLDIQDV